MLGMPMLQIVNALLWAGVLVSLVAGLVACWRYRRARAASFALLAGGFVLLALNTLTGFVANSLFEALFLPLTEESVARSLPFSNAALLIGQVLYLLGIVLLAVGIVKLKGDLA